MRSDSLSTLVLVCVVATLCYIVPKLAGALISSPQTVWPLWPGCAILVSGLLLVPLRIWPILIAASFAGFCLYDLQVGVPIGSITWFILADTVQVLVAALGLRYCFNDVPRLNSIRALAKYSFFAVILGPFAAAFLSARGIGGDYWNGWSICFFSEVLAFVTVAPAILSWITEGPAWARKSRAYHLEAAALTVGLVLLGLLAFTASTRSNSPVLLYSLVPFLLWSALRFGSIGISTSVVVVAFLSIWSSVHNRGPFTEQGPHSMLSLQLFLVFAATPFMVLAALVEDRKLASRELALANDRFVLAMEAGTSVAWDLDVRSGRDLWFGNLQTVFGIPSDTRVGDAQDFIRYVHPDDRQRVSEALADARQDRKLYAPEFRIVRPDGMIRWVVARGKFYYATNGDPERMLGVSLDITERKVAEEAVRESDSRYRRIVETTNEGVWLLDSKLHTSYVNPQMAEMLGYEPGEMVGRSVFDFYFPEDVGQKKQVLERRQQGVREQIEERLRRRDGSDLWVRMAANPIVKDAGEFDGALAMVADITDKKKAEEALLRHAAVIESSDDAIASGTLDGIIVSWNTAARKIYGYTEAEAVGKPIAMLAPPERLDEENKILEILKAGGRIEHFETVRVTKTGKRINVSLTISPIKDSSGRTVGCSGIARDITDRKRTEEALRKGEERFRLAAQAGKMYAYEWDVATDMVLRSEEHVNVLGFSDQGKQLTRQQLLTRVHADDRALFIGSVDKLTPQNPTTQISYRLVHPDGSVVWLEKSARAFFDEKGRMLRVIGMVADVTERKHAEEAKRESEDRLQLLLDSTGEAIYGIDLEGRCTFCNPACLRALGYKRVDELLGKNMHGLIHHTRADGSAFPVEECRIFRAIRAGEGAHVDDEVLWRANRTSFPAEYWSYPQWRGQEVVGAVVAFVDITERKLAETALANVSRRLIEAQEQERTRIARELHDDFAQRLALLAVELEQLHQDPPDLPEVRGIVGKLQKQTTEIATDIQTLSRELHSTKLLYLGIAAAMRSFCQEFGERTKVKIDFKSHDLPSPLSPDVSLCLFRVLQEALHNSAKHSGVRHVEVRLWGTSDEILLTVSDAGAGFDTEAARRNQGLGLISMEERLKLVKGTFSIESQPERGTTIHARVPLSSVTDSMRAAG